jgi:hypothetical protein
MDVEWGYYLCEACGWKSELHEITLEFVIPKKDAVKNGE